ncbi:MAG: class I SAM-dependent methyltransferase [Actinomycetota bacterium]
MTTTTAATTTLSPARTDGSSVEPGASFDNGARGRFNAWFFTAFDRYINYLTRSRKQAAFAGIEVGHVVELGAGVGANFDYVPTGSRLVAVEPNRAMHDGLRSRAADRGVELVLLGSGAEDVPLADGSVDDIVCSLVLCTVEDQDAVLAEVKRLLRPGGRFRFVEHVAAPRWSPRRLLQATLRRPWRWVYEGCELCRDTATAVEQAGFSSVEIDRGRFRRSLFVPVNTAISGVAVR